MAFVRFVTRRILRGLVALVVFLFVVYLAVGSFIPNDANSLFPVMTPGELEDYRAKLGLERPLTVQFLIWIRGVLTGELGRTTFGAPVATRIGDALARTLFVFSVGIPLAFVLGSWLGRRSGWKRKPGSDAPTVMAVVMGTAFPPFLAFLLTYILREQTTVLADVRKATVGDSRQAWADAGVGQTDVLWGVVITLALASLFVAVVRWAGFRARTISASIHLAVAAAVAVLAWWAVTDLERNALDLLIAAAVPILAFTILSFGEFMVVGQAATAAAQHEDFVVAARAKGLSSKQVRDRHASRAAQLVVLSRLAISLPYLMTGLVIIEQAVDWPGLGDFLFQALQGRDLPTIMSSLLVIGLFTVASRIVLDLMQRVLDPRLGPEGRFA